MSKLSLFAVAFFVAMSFANANDDVDEAWKLFKEQHNKNYRSTDEAARKRLFSQTHDMIKEHNSNNPEFQLAHNEFSDMTKREKERYLGVDSELLNHSKNREFIYSSASYEDRQAGSLDYRTHPCLTPIRSQGQCGSCWAFTTIAPLEFAQCKKNNNVTVALSEQQLLDCDTADFGCNGGFYTTAWNYLKKGSAKRASYSAYTAKGGSCTYSSTMLGATVSDYGYVQPSDIISALTNKGPLAAALNVVDDFYNYQSGVYSSDVCAGSINHGVVIVGYGVQDGVPHWIVRNSWGTWWGVNGYILIKRGENMCNIESWAYYVTVV